MSRVTWFLSFFLFANTLVGQGFASAEALQLAIKRSDQATNTHSTCAHWAQRADLYLEAAFVLLRPEQEQKQFGVQYANLPQLDLVLERAKVAFRETEKLCGDQERKVQPNRYAYSAAGSQFSLYKAFVLYARQEWEEQNYGHAASAFENAVRLAEKDKKQGAELYFNTAKAFSLAGKHEKALFYVKKAIDNGCKRSDAYFLKARTLIFLQKQDEVVLTLENGLERFPNDSLIGQMLVDVYTKRGAWQKALEALEVSGVNKQGYSFFFQKAAMLSKLGQDSLAVLAYEKCLDLKPKSKEVHYNLAVLYYNAGISIYKNKTEGACPDACELLELARLHFGKVNMQQPTEEITKILVQIREVMKDLCGH